VNDDGRRILYVRQPVYHVERGYNNLNCSSSLPHFHIKPIEFIVSVRD
jgi:hypothetical protein